MKSKSMTLTVTGANASAEVMLVALKALTKSSCKMTSFEFSGTYRQAELKLTVEGTENEVNLFDAVIDGWRNTVK